MPHSLPPLPYPHDALEPHIDAETMRIHHGRHHRTYVDKLNAALTEHTDLAGLPIEELLARISAVPDAIRTAVVNHGGGHLNHGIFWENMAPGGGKPSGALAAGLKKAFGNFASFQEKFTAAAVGVFGSGWAWLVFNQGQLEIITRPNQDSPVMDGLVPLLGLDVWEHAYYLKYQNRRPEYVKAWWEIVNWQNIERRFTSAVR